MSSGSKVSICLAVAVAACLLAVPLAGADDNDQTKPTVRAFQIGPGAWLSGESPPLAHAMSVTSHGPWIGVMCQPTSETLKKQLNIDGGLVVQHIVPNTPAAKAGLEVHDVILSAGGKNLSSVPELMKLVQSTDKAGVEFSILRGGKKKTITVKPAKRPEANDAIERVMPHLEKLDLPELPKEHRMKIEELMKQIEARKVDGMPHRFHHIGPGVVIEGAVAGSSDFPKGLAVQITKSGEGPAKVTVTKGDKKWEVTEDELDELPEDIRPHIKGMLGKKSPFGIDIKAIPLGPDAIKAVPHFRVHPRAPNNDVEDVHRRAQERIREIQKQLNELQKELSQMPRQHSMHVKPDVKVETRVIRLEELKVPKASDTKE
jgi:hypothetical protein